MSSELQSGPLASRVRAHLRRGEVAQATAVVDDELARVPDDVVAWYFRGVIANRCRNHEAAVVALRKVVAAMPDASLAWLALGTACARSNRLKDATQAYSNAIACEPGWADAHLNLGLVHKRMEDRVGALGSLYAAWKCDPMLFEAGSQCVATIAECVRRGEVDVAWPIAIDHGRRSSVLVVTCSIDETKRNNVRSLYERLFSGFPLEIASVRDARSLADAYNAVVSQSSAEIVVLSHDDIDVLAPDFALRLIGALTEFDAVGVIGSTRMDGPTVGWSGHPHLRGWITHRMPGDSMYQVDLLDLRASAAGAVVLDGVLLAARRGVLSAVPFDAVTFDGFHLYDIDWSFRASRAGFRVGVRGDLLVVHASRGRYDDAWERYASRFCEKYACGTAPPARSSFFGARLETAGQVRDFFAVLSHLDGGSGDSLRRRTSCC
jgi:tetratricopeptide (TPR) repeat protein